MIFEKQSEMSHTQIDYEQNNQQLNSISSIQQESIIKDSEATMLNAKKEKLKEMNIRLKEEELLEHK